MNERRKRRIGDGQLNAMESEEMETKREKIMWRNETQNWGSGNENKKKVQAQTEKG